ncbi:MAG: cytochrome b [Pseudomonadota bacterium]
MFNSASNYGWVSRLLHWVMAVAVVAMFALGLWMRELDYYSPYYQIAPNLHKSFGIVLFLLLTVRLIWNMANPKPYHDGLSPMVRTASKLGHAVLYCLLFILMIAGYFISTADGRPIVVFSTVEVPAVITKKGLEATAGLIHYYVAFAIIGLSILHASAALYHHFVKKDNVLRSMMVGKTKSRPIGKKTKSASL